MVKHIGQIDNNKRFRNICSLIKRKVIVQRSSNNKYKTIIIPSISKKKIVLTAHYDTYPNSLGYNDNAAGIVSILNIIDDLPHNVEVVFTDAEEKAGVGCAMYIESYKDAILYNLNIDVVGLGKNIFYEIRCDKNNIIKHSLSQHQYLNIPFNDSYVFHSFNIPTMTIISGSKPIDKVIAEIWDAEHGGKNDNKIELISADAVQNVSNYLVGVLNA